MGVMSIFFIDETVYTIIFSIITLKKKCFILFFFFFMPKSSRQGRPVLLSLFKHDTHLKWKMETM